MHQKAYWLAPGPMIGHADSTSYRGVMPNDPTQRNSGAPLAGAGVAGRFLEVVAADAGAGGDGGRKG